MPHSIRTSAAKRHDAPVGAGRQVAAFVITAVMLFVLLLVAVNTGSLQASPAELFNGLFVEYNDTVATIYDLRFPRIVIALAGGAALATSGVLLQAVIRNPLADPGIIGINAGAGFCAVLATALFPALFYFTPLFAFIGGIIAFALVYTLSGHNGLSPLRIVLVGVAVGALFGGLSAAIGSAGSANSSAVSNILDANITMKSWADARSMAIYGGVGLVAALFTASRCDMLMLEDKTAQSLGVNVNASRAVISIVAVLLASITTAIVGPISFLGLVVPHLARLIVGTGHKALIPYSMLLGAFCLLLADTIGRTIIAPVEISPAVCMSIVGGPVFIVLLMKARDTYGV